MLVKMERNITRVNVVTVLALCVLSKFQHREMLFMPSFSLHAKKWIRDKLPAFLLWTLKNKKERKKERKDERKKEKLISLLVSIFLPLNYYYMVKLWKCKLQDSMYTATNSLRLFIIQNTILLCIHMPYVRECLYNGMQCWSRLY
jgi:hypothetical protein